MEAIRVPGNIPVGEQCNVRDLEKVTLRNVGIPMRFWFGNDTVERRTVTYLRDAFTD